MFYDRVATILYAECRFVYDLWAVVVVLYCIVRKTKQAVYLGYDVGVGLYGGDIRLYGGQQLLINIQLYGEYFLFRAQYFFFVFF